MLIFAIVVLLLLIAVVQSTYGRSGSAIGRHPYFRRTSDCPGARAGSHVSGREGIARMSSRGTR